MDSILVSFLLVFFFAFGCLWGLISVLFYLVCSFLVA